VHRKETNSLQEEEMIKKCEIEGKRIYNLQSTVYGPVGFPKAHTQKRGISIWVLSPAATTRPSPMPGYRGETNEKTRGEIQGKDSRKRRKEDEKRRADRSKERTEGGNETRRDRRKEQGNGDGPKSRLQHVYVLRSTFCSLRYTIYDLQEKRRKNKGKTRKKDEGKNGR
jgi:hypothetical protein